MVQQNITRKVVDIGLLDRIFTLLELDARISSRIVGYQELYQHSDLAVVQENTAMQEYTIQE